MKVAVLLSICVLQVLAAVMVETPEPSVDGKYIAVFHTHATEEERFELVDRLSEKRKRSEEGELSHHSLHEFNAFSGHFTQEGLEELLKEEKIDYIQPNIRKQASQKCTTSRGAWHLQRINLKKSPIRYSNTYTWSEGAGNVTAYIMDSGVEVTHPEFEGRATWGTNTADRTDRDCNGHGTHVAGTVGSKTYGVAKNVRIVAVKVLNCEGSGSSLTSMRGHEWIAKDQRVRKTRAVVNMSLGGPYDRAENDIIRNAVRLGLVYVVAAGNDFSDACRESPASAPDAICVGATDMRDRFTDFSNWGRCVSILAPGQEITSTWPGRSTNTIDGTSMACPHVAGAAAIALARNPNATPAQIKSLLTTAGLGQTIDRIPRNSGTTSTFLFSAC